ncbi:MAG: hypothetical protein ABSA02_24280 [Trebonia sp.]
MSEDPAPEVIDGIRSLHERIDELHRLVALRLEPESVHTAGEWVHTRAGTALHAARTVPAWKRRTQGERRWPVTLTTGAAIALQFAVPDRLVLVHPYWLLPAVQGALLIALVMANPHRIDRESKALRVLALTFAALLSLANGWSVARLAIGITEGTTDTTPARLLVGGAMIWLTNVVVFALWYWEFDRGGPVARALNVKAYPDFQFVQMVSPPEMVPPDWEPSFVDYLYLALTNAAAFSPTDVMPLSRWAKLAMAAQSLVSIVTVALVVSRAVNILQLSRYLTAVCAHQRFRRNVLDMLLPTSLVGSYPQPDWLIDRARLAGRFPPRVRARELWRVDPEFLDQAQADATLLAIRAQEDAGLDIITDGEIRRESYSNRFATALDGVDIDNPGTALDRSGHPNPVPRVTGPIRRRHAVEVADLEFLRAHTSRTIKITVPGPFTMAQQAQDDFYGSREALAFGYAEAVNEEIRDLFAAGADIVQLDEPYLQARAAEAAHYGVKVVNRALDGVTGLGTTALHLCFGYAAVIHERPAGYSFLPELAACDVEQISIETAQSNLDTSVLSALSGKTIILGVLDLSDPAVETPAVVAERVRRTLPYVPADRLVLAPDCGMKYLPRESADGKMASLAAAAAELRVELGG